MVEMTVQLPEDLAARLRPLGPWLPTVLQLSLDGFKTVASASAAEVIQFLSATPTDEQVLQYHASKRSQQRLGRLLTLSDAGMLGEDEQEELEELQRIEHTIVMLKTEVASREVPSS